MNNFYKLTKEELIVRYRKLQSENEKLKDELDRLSDCYCEIENRLAETVNLFDSTDTIKDVDLFKWRLQLANLLTPQLESFIEYYLRFYNEVKG